MSWDGNYWGRDGALKKAYDVFLKSKQTSSDHVSYASVCYSSAIRAWAEAKYELKQIHIFKAVTWLWQVWKRGHEALQHIDIAWSGRGSETVTSEQFDQIDIGLAVVLQFGFGPNRKMQVHNILEDVFPKVVAQDCVATAHTRAFIMSHALKSKFLVNTQDAHNLIMRMEGFAYKSEENGEIAQASRVWKHVAQHWKEYGRVGEHTEAMKRAERLALISSSDQVRKLKI